MNPGLSAYITARTILILFLIAVNLADLQGQSDSIRISLGVENQSLTSTLRKIKKETGVPFAYDARALSKIQVTVEADDRSLYEFLQLLFENSGYNYKVFGETIAIIPIPAPSPNQLSTRVSGQAINVKSGESLPFTSVMVKGTQNATIANQDGRFSLNNIPSDTCTLVLNFIGYNTAEYNLSTASNLQDLKIYLLPTTNSLPEARVVENEGNLVKVDPLPSVMSSNVSSADLAGNVGIKDPFKTLQLLPGVNASSENNGGLIIRGSGSDQLLILFDGFTVYHVDHFYGIFSAFNPESIKHMRLHKGAFQARLGDRNSGVLEITGKEGSRYNRRITAGMNLLSADIGIEVPILANNGSLVISGRRSYTDVVPTYLFKDLFNTLYNSSILQGNSTGNEDSFDSGQDPKFSFYDLTARLTYDPSEKDRINFTVYHGRDKLQFQYSDPSPELGSLIEYNDQSIWGNTGLSGRWGHKWNSKNYTNAVLAYSNYSSSLDTRDVLTNTIINQSDTLFTEQSSQLQDRTLRLNHEINHDGHKVSTGLWVTNRLINYDFKALSEGQIAFLEQQGNTVAIYTQDDFKIDKWMFNLGLRMSYNDLAEDLRGEPRMAVTYNAEGKVSPKFAVGWHHQDVRRIRRQNLFLNTPDVWRLSNLSSIPVLSSVQFTSGAQGKAGKISWDAELFYKESKGEILDPLNLEVGQDSQFLIGEGKSYGIDVLLQYSWKNLRTQLSYTFSESILKFNEINGGDWIYSPYDLRHQLKCLQHFRKGNWDFSAAFVFSTGNNYTPALGLYEVELVNGTQEMYAAFGIPFSSVLPAYHRLDLTANYRFNWQDAIVEAGVSIFNAYNRENIRSRSYRLVNNGSSASLNTNSLQMIGFLPSINLRFTWE